MFSNTTINLSEQYLISNDFGPADNYCNGGLITYALPWLILNKQTVETTADYAYNPLNPTYIANRNGAIMLP